MLPPVIVDLGPDVGRAAIEIVLDACNEVIQNGVCLPEGAPHVEAPRATALALPDESGLSVRIEVRLGLMEESTALVRELRFRARDPRRERWRSVGLAIATLVGERERQHAAEELLEAEPEAAEPEAAEPLQPEPAAAERRRVPSQGSPFAEGVASQRASAVGSAATVAYAGAGVSTGPGFRDDVWRLGASARAGWGYASGLQLVALADYSWRLAQSDYTGSWLSLQAGVAYRLRWSERVSSAVALRGGVQRMRFEALARGELASEVAWNPVVALGIDLWWLLGSNVALWAAADAQSIARETRLFVVRERGEPVRSYPVDVSAVVGLGYWIP